MELHEDIGYKRAGRQIKLPRKVCLAFQLKRFRFLFIWLLAHIIFVLMIYSIFKFLYFGSHYFSLPKLGHNKLVIISFRNRNLSITNTCLPCVSVRDFESCMGVFDNYLCRYMLTEEGKKAARECLSRSGLATSSDTVERSLDFDESIPTNQEFPHNDSVQESRLRHVSIAHKESAEVPPESLNRV